MNIGISYWGFCETFNNSLKANTPDGHRYGRPILIDDLLRKGHAVYAMQAKREPYSYPDLLYANPKFPDLDILFLEWRWPTYKNCGDLKFEPDLDRQKELLEYYHGKIPIIAWDTDLKMTPEDELAWPEMLIADPTFEPKYLTRPRTRLTFWSDFKPLFDPCEDSVEFGYVGNNYERESMFMKYYSNPSMFLRARGIQTKVWGNWLQRSPERDQPEELISKHPHIAFSDRASFKKSMGILNKFICTVHITKPRYAIQGFASPRYLENIVTNTPSLVPAEFNRNDILGDHWKVSNDADVIRLVVELKSMSASERLAVVNAQRDNLLKVHDFRVNNVVSLIESLT